MNVRRRVLKIELPYGGGCQILNAGDIYGAVCSGDVYRAKSGGSCGGLDVEVLRSAAGGEGAAAGAIAAGEDGAVAGAAFAGVDGAVAGAAFAGVDGAVAGAIAAGGGDGLVRDAMASPIASRRLAELARGARDAVVICSDHTRPVPSRIIIPRMLAELREGNPDIKVTLLIATGMHRAPSQAELAAKFGEKVAAAEHIAIHDSKDADSMRRIGTLPSGAELIINKIAAETDLLVAEGFIEPHFFAGFSGGRKSILPGICAYKTVLGNHCAGFIADPASRAGVLTGNPIHRDMAEAQRLAKLAYIVNVIIDDKKRIARAFAGNPEAAHSKGCEVLAGMCGVTPARLADIVITTNGGAPLDQNIYQAVKGMSAAESAAAPDAVIVALSECADGAGGDSFARMMRECESPKALLEAIGRVPMDKTAEDQWQAQILARILSKHKVILVCDQKAREAAGQMKLMTASSADEAFSMALSMKCGMAQKKPAVTIIPDGVSVIVKQPENG